MAGKWLEKLHHAILFTMGVYEMREACCEDGEHVGPPGTLAGVPEYLIKPQYVNEIDQLEELLGVPVYAVFAGPDTTDTDAINITASQSDGLRTVSYWSRGGHFYRWTYKQDLRRELFRHVGRMAADSCVEFTWNDARDVHEHIKFRELTWDSQDVVGW